MNALMGMCPRCGRPLQLCRCYPGGILNMEKFNPTAKGGPILESRAKEALEKVVNPMRFKTFPKRD